MNSVKFVVVYLLSVYFLSDFDSDELEILARSGDEESASEESADDDSVDDDEEEEEGDGSNDGSEEDDIDEKEDIVKNFELSDSD